MDPITETGPIAWSKYKHGAPDGEMSLIARTAIDKMFKKRGNYGEVWRKVEADGLNGKSHSSIKAYCSLHVREMKGEDLPPPLVLPFDSVKGAQSIVG